MDGSKSQMTEPLNNETMTLPKDHTVRTDDAGHRMDMRLKRASGDIDDYLTANLNPCNNKRYRNTAENSIDLCKHENFMRKIRVTHVGCSELSQPVNKPPSDLCLPQDNLSISGGERAKPLPPAEILESQSNDGGIYSKTKI